jgi:hypothetical protein
MMDSESDIYASMHKLMHEWPAFESKVRHWQLNNCNDAVGCNVFYIQFPKLPAETRRHWNDIFTYMGSLVAKVLHRRDLLRWLDFVMETCLFDDTLIVSSKSDFESDIIDQSGFGPDALFKYRRLYSTVLEYLLERYSTGKIVKIDDFCRTEDGHVTRSYAWLDEDRTLRVRGTSASGDYTFWPVESLPATVSIDDDPVKAKRDPVRFYDANGFGSEFPDYDNDRPLDGDVSWYFIGDLTCARVTDCPALHRAASKIKRAFRHYKRNRAAARIQQGMHHWLNGGQLRDGTTGIRLRLMIRRDFGLLGKRKISMIED